MITTIQKRDGSFLPYNETKINLVIDYACEGLKVDSNKLKDKIKLFIHEKISTSNIQQILINNALSFVNIEEADWKFVASRLLLLDMYKRAKVTQGYKSFGYGDYLSFIKMAINDGLYDPIICTSYSEEEINELGKEINPDYDLGYDYGGMMSMHDRYLIKKDGSVFELPQQMYMSIAMFLALKEHKASRLKWVKKFYHACADRYLSPATPIMLNLRKKNGNLASCFIGAMDDDIESIYGTLETAAQISKNAGGVGINISRVRSHGSYIRNVKGASNGVFGWIKLLNDTAVSVNQLGSRSGAITVALDVWHRDILEFLEIQAENGDQRNKSYDIFPQIVVNNYFLEKYKLGQDWYLFDPHEIREKYCVEIAELYGQEFRDLYDELVKDANHGKIELFDRIKARDIVVKALQSAMETGMPYWFNKDTVNKYNPNKHVGMIGSANLCTESFSNFSPTKTRDLTIDEEDDGTYVSKMIKKLGYFHCCNLISVNASKVYNDNLESTIRLATRILDNALDIGTPPVPEAQIHNDDYRILGIGMLGLHDHLIKVGLTYSDSADYVDEYFERIAYYAVDESANLARDRGRYKYFEGSDWDQGIFFGKTVEQLETISKAKMNWKALNNKVQQYGLRNGGLLAVAPNTSTSILVGASASILPVFDLFFNEKNSLGTSPVIAQFLSPETLWQYESFKNINQKKVIDVCSRAQKWIDQGISMELLLNMDIIMTATELKDLYMYAMEAECKTIYYLRSKTKKTKVEKATEKIVKSEEEACMLCAN